MQKVELFSFKEIEMVNGYQFYGWLFSAKLRKNFCIHGIMH